MQLPQLKPYQLARITAIRTVRQDSQGDSATSAGQSVQPPVDAISRRLMTLGFIPGEQVKVLAAGLFGRDPLLVQVGFTRFALRRTEAERIQVEAIHP